MTDISIDYRRTWFEGRDLSIRIVGFGASKYITRMKCDGGHSKQQVYNSQDEAIQKLPSLINEYQAELVAGVAATHEQPLKQALERVDYAGVANWAVGAFPSESEDYQVRRALQHIGPKADPKQMRAAISNERLKA